VTAPEASLQPADSDLIERARNREQAAFGVLMQRHYERTFRLVYSIVRHEADARDVCQEVWLTVWQQLADFRGEARFTTWLHTITVRRALDHLRKRRRWFDRFLSFSSTGEQEFAAPDVTVTDVAKGDERIALTRKAIDSLPAKHRAVLALRELEGLSYEEIAAAMKIPAGTVMSRIYHARRLLAKKLGAKL
jgi:RNA polymerase sigma-70 factor, ECF subfamily